MTTLLQWNCRSIFPKKDEFQYLVQQTKCDVFALCETWLEKDSTFNLRGFNIIHLGREGGNGGGVLLGIKRGVNFHKIELPVYPGIEIIAIEATINGKTFSIASIYLPPAVRVGYHHIKNILETLPEPRVILGDFNSHGTGWGEPIDDNRSTIIYDVCDEFRMTILNTGKITRIPKPPNRGSRLDLSLCSRSSALDCSWDVLEDPHRSDHLPITITIKNGTNDPEMVNVPYDLTRNIDWGQFASEISEGMDSVNELPPLEEYSFIENLIRSSALKAQTKRVPDTPFLIKTTSPWWDRECTDMYQQKSEAFKVFRKYGSIELYDQYVELEGRLRNLIQAKKRGYWRKFVNDLTPDTSMNVLWSTARKMRNHTPSNENEKYSDSWILEFAKKVCPDSVPTEQLYREASSERSPIESPFTMTEFSLALLSCNNTAPGIDGIKFKLLKNLPDIAKRRLLNLFNNIFEFNIVPIQWRQVRVIAIKKPGKPASDSNSYRPIAMLSCIRKLFEKMILSRLDKWVEDNKLLSPTQFGFRRGKSTNDCLALLSSEIQIAFAQKQQLASVFLDIKGAFDCVPIEVLSESLQKSGLPPMLNNFLYNLLAEKVMQVMSFSRIKCKSVTL